MRAHRRDEPVALATVGPGTTRRPPHPLLQLQALVGNRATTSYLQRRIVVDGPRTLAGHHLPRPQNVLTPSQRGAFAATHRFEWTYDGRPRAALAGRVLTDLAATSNALKFADEPELVREVVKRVNTAAGMRTSQGMQVHGHWVFAFGYPHRPASGSGHGSTKRR